MGCWNHRVRKSIVNGTAVYDIVEAYYASHKDADNDKHNGYTAEGITPGSETLHGLHWEVEAMMQAFSRPIIEDEV